MTKPDERLNNTEGRELRLTRVLDAPRALVWEVWTKPEHIKNWWGPTGFTDTILKMEVKPDGEWEHIMHGPDGKDYKNKVMFRKVVTLERLEFEHVNEPWHYTTVTFTEQGNKTLLEWHMIFENKEHFEIVVKHFKADGGLVQNVDKMEAYLSNMQK